ncbi:MAG: hypothetical protein H0V25_04520 [Solirubrobacterales bacterium]|nr:hypothetical protein [Solirubrobacterales bacterium]
MSTATATKTRPVVEFTCARCRVTSRWTEGLGSAAPPNWDTVDGSYYCLVCRRERAIDDAIAKAGDVSTADRAKLRSSAVVDFEIARNPNRTEGEIAKAARASIGAVRKARKRRPS